MIAIRNNPHLVALTTVGFTLLAGSVLVLLNTRGFRQNFARVAEPFAAGQKLDIVDLGPLNAAEKQMATPTQWLGELFVPSRYVVDRSSNLPKLVPDCRFFVHSRTKQDIPNRWLEENHLSLRDSKVLSSDADNDGISNEDEWLWKTDPNSAASHPPYYSELFLRKVVRVPFRLMFQTYVGDEKKPAEITFQINALDRGHKTEFLKLGDIVANTKYRLEKFTYKTVFDERIQESQDVSELTVLNLATGESTVLPMTKLTNAPESTAVFTYEWPVGSRKEIQVKRAAEFVLSPEMDKRYKLLEVNDNAAIIQTPAGEKVSIGPDSRL